MTNSSGENAMDSNLHIWVKAIKQALEDCRVKGSNEKPNKQAVLLDLKGR